MQKLTEFLILTGMSQMQSSPSLLFLKKKGQKTEKLSECTEQRWEWMLLYALYMWLDFLFKGVTRCTKCSCHMKPHL